VTAVGGILPQVRPLLVGRSQATPGVQQDGGPRQASLTVSNDVPANRAWKYDDKAVLPGEVRVRTNALHTSASRTADCERFPSSRVANKSRRRHRDEEVWVYTSKTNGCGQSEGGEAPTINRATKRVEPVRVSTSEIDVSGHFAGKGATTKIRRTEQVEQVRGSTSEIDV